MKTETKKFLLKVARETIYSKLNNLLLPKYEITDDVLNEKHGVFVTLHKKGKLRGCIGYVLPVKPLLESVIDMAISSAFKDPRFPKLKKEEFDEIDIEISVLSPLKQIKNIDEIKVGRDGIVIKQGYNSGLLLPQVATEQHWDRIEFLKHTCLKAGLPPDAWKDTTTEIYIFSADVFSEKEFG